MFLKIWEAIYDGGLLSFIQRCVHDGCRGLGSDWSKFCNRFLSYYMLRTMGNRYFYSTFPDFILSQNRICTLNCEMPTSVVALKLWGEQWKQTRVVIYCDNLVSVRMLITLSTRNVFLQSCLREISLTAATKKFEINPCITSVRPIE